MYKVKVVFYSGKSEMISVSDAKQARNRANIAYTRDGVKEVYIDNILFVKPSN